MLVFIKTVNTSFCSEGISSVKQVSEFFTTEKFNKELLQYLHMRLSINLSINPFNFLVPYLLVYDNTNMLCRYLT